MDIAVQIKNARTRAGYTQEQAAEALSVSRQTVSNWEKAKTYPDIASVVKMSDLYAISLDVLLKGETAQSAYVTYLQESTDTVKGKEKLGRLNVTVTYLIIWAASILVFWFSPDDAAGIYSLGVIWLLLPIATFVTSLLIGANNYWGRQKWWLVLVFGVLYMLVPYCTFSAGNTAAFGNLHAPDLWMIPLGAIFSAAGMGLGAGANAAKKKKNRKQTK